MSADTIELLETCIGQPKIIAQDQHGSDIWSSIDRQPVAGPSLYLTWTGLAGDQPTETRPKATGGQIHGGHDKAVYVYPWEHYVPWQAELGNKGLGQRSFGENWCVAGANETSVHIGDVWELGEARLEVSKVRAPCQTLAAYFDDRSMIKRMRANGRCGWYMRVLRPGLVPAQGDIQVLSRNVGGPTVAAAFAAKMNK